VGDKFGAGELILPFVLQSAEAMKKAVKHLEQFLERAEGYTKGKVVLATVYGDVHDIGKSLVNTILSNNGYTVFDLGKQVPVNTIIDKAVELERMRSVCRRCWCHVRSRCRCVCRDSIGAD
jgi:5-methyltetrahydrofolate--homocysteine methyltransferase